MKFIPCELLSAPDVTALFTTRHGGVSRLSYSTANLAFHVGDDPIDVIRNHDLLAEAVGFDRRRLVYMRQIHSDRVVVVDESITFDTPPECDALITDRPNLPLMVMSADCTPILLHDPVRGAIGAVHAGRAGALSAILPKTIRRMAESYATDLRNLRISMGPSICAECYEINSAIAAEVERAGYPDALRRDGEKVFLEVNAILRSQLEEMGVRPDQLETVETCTSCGCDTYFSYRADAQRTGRIAGVIMLRR